MPHDIHNSCDLEILLSYRKLNNAAYQLLTFGLSGVH